MFTPREMAQLRRLELMASKMKRGVLQGEREVSRSGPGTSFREHRAYNEGDALRMVDWNVYARTNTLVVKEFDAEEALDIVLVQDCSESMRGAAATCAAKVTAALGVVALSGFDRVAWAPAGGSGAQRAQTFTGRGRMLDLLDAVSKEPGGDTDLFGALRAAVRRESQGGVAFVISDFFDPRSGTRALSYLQSKRYQLRAILIEDAEALKPPEPGRTRLIDSETGETLVLEITPEVIDGYVKAREARVQSMQAFCKRSGAGFLRVRAQAPFFEVVHTAIRRGWLIP